MIPTISLHDLAEVFIAGFVIGGLISTYLHYRLNNKRSSKHGHGG